MKENENAHPDEQAVGQTPAEFVNLEEIQEQFEEKGFFRRLVDMFKGFRQPRTSREYKEARLNFQRLAAPLIAVVSVTLFVVVLIVVTTVQGARKKAYEIRIAQIEEEPESLLEPEEEDTPEEPDVDMTEDINVDITVPTTDIPVPSTDLAAPPANQPVSPAAASAAPSPVTMNAINAGVKMSSLGDSGSGWGKVVARKSGKKPNLDGCLIGTIIDFKKDGTGKDRPNWKKSYNDDARSLIENNFSQAALMKFHVPPKNVALTHLWIPPQDAANGPKAFGVEDTVKPSGFVVYYSGTLASYKKGKWRFWGYFDDFLFIRVNGKILFDSNGFDGKSSKRSDWKSSAPKEIGKAWCPQQNWGKMAPSDWFELQANKPVKIEIMIGEHPGGVVGGLVLIEEYGKTYPKNNDGTIAYPIFTMRPLPSSTRFNLQDDQLFQRTHHLMNVDSPRFNAGPKKEEKPAGVSADDVSVDVEI